MRIYKNQIKNVWPQYLKIELFLVLIIGITQLSLNTQNELAKYNWDIETLQKRIGPFKLPDPSHKGRFKSFTIILTEKRILTPELAIPESVASFEIIDENGLSHFKDSFNLELSKHGFNDSWTVAPKILEGSKGTGLIFYYSVVPSAPSSGELCQVFAFKKDKLTALSPPITVYGSIYPLRKGGSKDSERLNEGDTMKFGVWTGWFEVTVPIFIDLHELSKPKIIPKYYNNKYQQHTFDVITERQKIDEDEVLVRLFKDPKDISPYLMPVRNQSVVEFMEVLGNPVIESDDFLLRIDIKDPWLKVKINGIEGWVKDGEGFEALGLPAAG